MNSKTTLTLALVLVASALGLYVVRSGSRGETNAAATGPTFRASPISRDLIEDKLGDVVKVVCRRTDKETWIFEKKEPVEGGASSWRMTAPHDMKVVSWEAERFGRDLGKLQYEVSYRPGEPGAVTPSDAGLDPPKAEVTLTDADGKSVTIEIGKPASDQTTYVRRSGSDEVCVGQSNLRGLFKSNAIEYRDKEMLAFDAADATSLEIVDRSGEGEPVSYRFVRGGSRWMMESPVTARATSKVDDAVQALSRLRAVQWTRDDPKGLSFLDLDPAALTLRVTVEKKVEPEPDDAEGSTDKATEADKEEAPEPKPEIKTSVFEVHLSDRSPIGEDTKTFVRIGNETAVATIMKTTTDKLKPVMKEWRDMRLTSVDAGGATRVELSANGESMALVRKAEGWSIEGDETTAEKEAVTELLDAVGDLAAVAYVETSQDEQSAMGLAEPRAEVRLSIPGVEDVERISVGGYADQATKRLVYVRRNQSATVAKVRASSVEPLLRNTLAYRDRTIFDLPPDRIERMAITRNRAPSDEPSFVALERNASGWSMVEPIAAPVQQDRADKLSRTIGNLRAVMTVADATQLSAYGLHDPQATLTITYKPPVEHKVEQADSDREESAEYQPPSETWSLIATKHEGRIYARRGDRATIHEIANDLYDQLFAEFHAPEVLSFDDKEVQRFSIQSGDKTHAFLRNDQVWTYEAEPDLPLDAKKVDNLLLRVRDLKTQRFIRYQTGDDSDFGLGQPRHVVTVTLKDGTQLELIVSARKHESGAGTGFYAEIRGREGVFLLTPDTVSRMAVSLDELEG